jgi:hypothetical protein
MALNGATNNDPLGLNDVDFSDWINEGEWGLLAPSLLESNQTSIAEFLVPLYTNLAPAKLSTLSIVKSETMPEPIAEEPEESEESEEPEEKPKVRAARTKRRREPETDLEDELKLLEREIKQLVEEGESFAYSADPIKRRKSKNARSAALSRKRKRLEIVKAELEIKSLKEDKNDLQRENTELTRTSAVLQNLNQELARENALLKAQLADLQQRAQTEDYGVNVTTMLIRYTSPVTSPRKPSQSETHVRSHTTSVKFNV